MLLDLSYYLQYYEVIDALEDDRDSHFNIKNEYIKPLNP